MEWVVLETALGYTVPVVAGVTLLGMILSWSAARTLRGARLWVAASICGTANSLLYTVEDLPRGWGDWIALVLPVATVMVAILVTRWSAAGRGDEGIDPKFNRYGGG
jgi:CHASE2 domain-containing sensor protein